MLSFEIVKNVDHTLYAKRGESEWALRGYKGRQLSVGPASDQEAARAFCTMLDGGYERFVVFLEDAILVSPRQGEVVCLDTITGTIDKGEWTTEQLNAVCTLAIGGDEVEYSAQIYPIAELALANWNCRPIP